MFLKDFWVITKERRPFFYKGYMISLTHLSTVLGTSLYTNRMEFGFFTILRRTSSRYVLSNSTILQNIKSQCLLRWLYLFKWKLFHYQKSVCPCKSDDIRQCLIWHNSPRYVVCYLVLKYTCVHVFCRWQVPMFPLYGKVWVTFPVVSVYPCILSDTSPRFHTMEKCG